MKGEEGAAWRRGRVSIRGAKEEGGEGEKRVVLAMVVGGKCWGRRAMGGERGRRTG